MAQDNARYNELKQKRDQGSLQGADVQEFEKLEKERSNQGQTQDQNPNRQNQG